MEESEDSEAQVQLKAKSLTMSNIADNAQKDDEKNKEKENDEECKERSMLNAEKEKGKDKKRNIVKEVGKGIKQTRGKHENNTHNLKYREKSAYDEENDAEGDTGKEKDINIEEEGGRGDPGTANEKNNATNQCEEKCQVKVNQLSEEEKWVNKEKIICDIQYIKKDKEDKKQNIILITCMSGESQIIHQDCKEMSGKQRVLNKNEGPKHADQETKRDIKNTDEAEEEEKVREEVEEKNFGEEESINQEGVEGSKTNKKDLSQKIKQQKDIEVVQTQADIETDNAGKKLGIPKTKMDRERQKYVKEELGNEESMENGMDNQVNLQESETKKGIERNAANPKNFQSLESQENVKNTVESEINKEKSIENKVNMGKVENEVNMEKVGNEVNMKKNVENEKETVENEVSSEGNIVNDKNIETNVEHEINMEKELEMQKNIEKNVVHETNIEKYLEEEKINKTAENGINMEKELVTQRNIEKNGEKKKNIVKEIGSTDNIEVNTEKQENAEELIGQESLEMCVEKHEAAELENRKILSEALGILENKEKKNHKNIEELESQESTKKLENQKNIDDIIENWNESGEKMEQQKGQEIPNKQKNNNVECQVNVINKTVYKKCQEQNLRLQTDASKCFKCMEEGTKFCKHTVEYSKDTTLEVGNTKDEMLQDQPKVREEKQKEESTKSVLERPVSEEKPDEPNKSSHIDHDPVEIKGVKKFFGQKKKSQILQRKCIKRLLTSEKEEYMESVCQSSLRDEKSAAVISEDERQSRVWGEDERGVTPNSTADQNILESTSSSNSQENEYQPCHSTDMSSGSQSSGSKSKVHTVANEANRGHQDSITNVDNFTDVHSENDQLSKDTDKNYQSPKKQKGVEGNQSACPLHKKLQDPESSQAKTESKSKMVECIDLLSDDDGGDDASTAYTSTTASKTLHHVREKIVPTVCEKCRSIWNNQVLSTIFLGVESVTVNSKITYGAIICINHWAESHYLSGKESAVRSLLDRADLCKNIGSLRISEVNHWLGSLMKAGKVKCCDVFEAFYQPDVQNKLLSSLPHTDVSTDKATGIKIRVDSVDGENQPPKKNISRSPKDCPSSLKNQSLTSPGYILPLQKGSDSAKNVLSGVWNTPVFDRKVVLPGIGQEKSATCLDKQGKSTSGYAQECATRNCQIDSGKTTSTEAVYSSSDMGKAVSPKQSLQSSSEKAELVLTEVTPPATKAGSSSEMVSPVSRKRTADMLIEDTPHTLRDENSQNLESVDSKITTTATLCEKPTTDLEKDVASHSETNETPPSMSYNVLQTDDTVAEKILDTSVSSTSHSNSTVITSLTLPPDASTSDCLNESLHSVSVEQEIDTPKRKRKRKRKSLAPPTRSARPIIHPSQSPTSQDATVTSSAMSPQHSTLVATNLTLTSHNKEAGKTTVSSTQEAASSIEQWPTLQQEHDPPLQPLQLQAVLNKEEQCSQEQHDINSTSTLQNAQNSSKVYMHQIDENSIPSDSDSGGGEDNLHVNSEESSSDNLCSVLGLNVSTLDTYCSSTDMKTITNGVMARNPSKRYKFSFCHYAMLKEQSALSGLAREAFNLMPFESDNCRPLAQGTNGRERFLTNRELLTLQSICILHPENPDVDLFFRILVQILMTRSRVLLVPNSLTLLLVAENLRRECNRAKTKGTYSMFLSQDWDTSNVYTAKDLLHSKLEKVKEPTVRSVLSVFCLWKNLGKQVTNISLPEALEDLCKNIDLTTSDKTKLCIKLYARFCEYLYEEKNSSLAEFFLNQPFTGCNTPMTRKVLINTMVTKLSLDITHLSSAGSLNIAEKEVQGALQKCLALEKAVLQSRNAQKEEEFRLNVVTFRDKLDRYKQVNDLLSKRMKIAEKEKQEVLTKIVDSKSRKLVRELGQTLTAIHQSLAKRKGVTGMDERENSRKALKVDYSTDIHSSVDICSRDRFSNTAASVDLGEDVSQTIREGIYELLASEVDVDQVRPVIYLIMNKVAGEEAPRLPSVSWIRNFARLNGFKIK